MLLVSSFLVFDSKGAEVLGPKAISTHNNTKSTNLNFLEDTMIQVKTFNWYQAYKWLWLWDDERGRTSFGNGTRKGRKVDYGVRGSLSP